MRIASRRPGAGRQRIFIDCTQTAARRASTGVSRVVRNIVAFGNRAASDQAVDLVPVRFQCGQFVPLATMSAGVIVSLSTPRPHPIAARLRKILVPSTYARNITASSAGLMPVRPAPAGVDLRAGDVLLLPDASWGVDMWSAVDRARQTGVALGVVQHDFLPIRHPDLVPSQSTTMFRGWMEATLGRADFVMAVSQSAAAEARHELMKLGRPDLAGSGVTSFRNGADFLDEADLRPPRVQPAIRQALVDFMEAGPAAPYLTVGTIEPRKNQSLLLRAVERMLAEAPDARFLFAGMVGWQGRPVAAALRGHPAWGRTILHIPDLNDTELKYAYRHAAALVVPSLAAGHGLPIVEAFARNLRVFASDLPVHREIGGDCCSYFDPHDPDQLADQLIAFSRNGRFAATWPPRRSTLPTWAEAAEQIIATALEHAQPPTPALPPNWHHCVAG